MKICGFNKTTLLDYPGRVACTIFLGGCNFRCPFCQNGALVVEPDTQPEYSQEEILAFLKKRKGILDGVCISGGEPTLAPELPEFLSRIRELGYDVKLDTNGSRPSVVKNLAAADLINKVAMDIKAFNDEEKYYNDVDDRIRELKASKLAKNSKGILMPGEIEDGKFKASEESGVVMVLPENLKMVNDLADEMGMERISVIE